MGGGIVLPDGRWYEHDGFSCVPDAISGVNKGVSDFSCVAGTPVMEESSPGDCHRSESVRMDLFDDCWLPYHYVYCLLYAGSSIEDVERFGALFEQKVSEVPVHGWGVSLPSRMPCQFYGGVQRFSSGPFGIGVMNYHVLVVFERPVKLVCPWQDYAIEGTGGGKVVVDYPSVGFDPNAWRSFKKIWQDFIEKDGVIERDGSGRRRVFGVRFDFLD